MVEGKTYLFRSLEDKLIKLFNNLPVVVIGGARQVGKSTLLDHVYGHKMPRIVFDPIEDVEGARADPDLFLKNRPAPIILDEIQYVPALVSAIKRRLEKDRRPGQYLITGSQQWEVLKNLQESLAGRAVFLDLSSFSLLEIQEKTQKIPLFKSWIENKGEFSGELTILDPLKFQLIEQIWRGFLPEAQFLPREVISSFYQGYHRTYIERDIREITQISDLDEFGRFHKLCAALSSQEINYSQLGRDIGVTPQTASRWLNVLKATYQWFDVPAFSGNTVKRVSSKPKGFLADTGLMCYAQMIPQPEGLRAHPLWGALFETMIFLEIKKQCEQLPLMPAIYHWRTNGGAEVDLILEYDGMFFPIEAKGKSHPTKKDARGILAFRETYSRLSIAKGIIVAPADSSYDVSEYAKVVPYNAVME